MVEHIYSVCDCYCQEMRRMEDSVLSKRGADLTGIELEHPSDHLSLSLSPLFTLSLAPLFTRCQLPLAHPFFFVCLHLLFLLFPACIASCVNADTLAKHRAGSTERSEQRKGTKGKTYLQSDA